MIRAVLDASAILALLNDEPGADLVAPYIAEGAVSAVNSAEVIGKLTEAGMPEQAAVEASSMLVLEVVDFDASLAVRTGALRPMTKKSGLSLGDRACLATAEALALPVVTADRRWGQLELGLTVDVIR